MTTTEIPAPAKTYTPFLDLLVAHYAEPLPEGYDTWGWKLTRPDLRTYQDYRWPWPGNTVTDPAAKPSDNPCPTRSTGGFCIALNWYGARSGGYPGITALLLAYRQSDVLASSQAEGKLRVREAHICDLIDVHRLVEKAGKGADLAGADLAGADLAGANLAGANLTRANLADADLAGADLTRADLAGADLAGADLTRANLTRAYLAGADLTRANLTRAIGHKPAAVTNGI